MLLPVPPTEGAQSMMIVLLQPEQPPRARLFDLRSGRPSLGDMVDSEEQLSSLELFALSFGCELDELQLPPGPVGLLEEQSQGRALPRALNTFTIDPQAAAPSWVATTPPPALSQLRLALEPIDFCARFSVAPIDVPDPDLANRAVDGRNAVLVQDGSLLAFTDVGKFFRIFGFPGPLQVVEQPYRPFDLPLTIVRGEEEDLWVFGQKGEVGLGNADAGFTLTSSATREVGNVAWLVSSQSGARAFEMYLLTDRKVIQQYNGRRWQTIAQGDGQDISWEGGLVWLGPGEILASGVRPHDILHISGTAQRWERVLPQDSLDRLNALYHDAQYTLVATNQGRLFSRENDQWTELPAPTESFFGARRINRFGERFLIGGEGGVFFQYHPAFGVCPTEQLSSQDVRAVVNVEGGFALVTQNQGGVILNHLKIESTPRSLSCLR